MFFSIGLFYCVEVKLQKENIYLPPIFIGLKDSPNFRPNKISKNIYDLFRISANYIVYSSYKA